MQTHFEKEIKPLNDELKKMIEVKREPDTKLKYAKVKIIGKWKLYQLPIYPDEFDLSDRPF